MDDLYLSISSSHPHTCKPADSDDLTMKSNVGDGPVSYSTSENGGSRPYTFPNSDLSQHYDCPACGTWVRVNTHCEHCGRLFVLPELPASQRVFSNPNRMAHGVKIPDKQFTEHQTDMDDFDYGERPSMPIDWMKKRYFRMNSGSSSKYCSYRLGAPGVKEAIQDGTYIPSEDLINSEYDQWVYDATIVGIENIITHEIHKKLAPKMGNPAYCNKKEKLIQALVDSMKGLKFDLPVSIGRGLDRDCLMWFTTLTYDHKRYTKLGAWARVAKDVTDFKRRIRRVIGHSGLFSIRVLEGGESGYPAPHIIIILNKPLKAFEYHGKWRVRDQRILLGYNKKLKNGSLTHIDGLNDKWKHGYIDFRAVVGQKVKEGGKQRDPIFYTTKYVTKNVGSVKDKVAKEMFSFLKLMHYRAIQISSAFRLMANRVSSRLDMTLSQSPHTSDDNQQQQSIFRAVSFQSCDLSKYSEVINAPPPQKSVRNDYDQWRHKKWFPQSACMD